MRPTPLPSMKSNEIRELIKEKIDAEYPGSSADTQDFVNKSMPEMPNIEDLTDYQATRSLTHYYGSIRGALWFIERMAKGMKEEVRNETAKACARTNNQTDKFMVDQIRRSFDETCQLFSGNSMTVAELRKEYQKVIQKLNEIRFEL